MNRNPYDVQIPEGVVPLRGTLAGARLEGYRSATPRMVFESLLAAYGSQGAGGTPPAHGVPSMATVARSEVPVGAALTPPIAPGALLGAPQPQVRPNASPLALGQEFQPRAPGQRPETEMLRRRRALSWLLFRP